MSDTSTLVLRRASTADEVVGARELFLRSLVEDQGHGYLPQWHWDIDHLQEMYVDNPRHAMIVALDGGEVVGTCGAWVGGPAHPPHPAWLADRYADRQRVAQVVRLVTTPRMRRQGLGRRLFDAVVEHLRADGGFRVAYLHTNAKTPGALDFWRSTGCVEVYDARPDEDDPRFETVHFELPL